MKKMNQSGDGSLIDFPIDPKYMSIKEPPKTTEKVSGI